MHPLRALHLKAQYLTLIAALSLPAIADDTARCAQPDDTLAIAALRERIKAESLYSSWAKEECLWFYPERCTHELVDVAVRELHVERCGDGDPNTGPIVDRFRVFKKSKNIEWYNPVDAEYSEFSKARSIGGR